MRVWLHVVIALVLSCIVRGQCSPEWIIRPENGIPGPNDRVTSLVLWNGRPIVGGHFYIAGNQLSRGVTEWTGTSWNSLGTNLLGDVESLTVMSDNTLVACTNSSNAIHRWTGSTWVNFSPHVASSWSITCVKGLANGRLLAGGSFCSLNGAPANGLIMWDGTTWSPVPNFPLHPIRVSEIEVANDGTVYVGGEYAGYSYTTTGFVVAGVGNTWTQLGAPLVGTWPGEHNPGYGSVWTVRPDVDGSIVAGGFFRQTEGHPVKSLAKWNGLTWAPYLGDVIGTVTDIERARDGSLLVLGGFDSIGTVPVHNAARVSGQTISGFGRGPTRSIRRLLEMPDGQIITGGDFLSELGQNAVESWNGAEWVPLGRGTNGRVDALAQLKSGEVVAAGTFTMIEGFSARNVARYDGSKWRPVGTGFDDYIWDICELPGGGLVAGGDFAIAGDVRASAIARWNGTEWQSMGGGLTGASLYGPSAYAVRALPNGDVIAGGDFTQAGGVPASFVARWDGAAWHPMGGGLAGRVLDLKLMPDRSVLAAGEFSGGVSRWNGSSWAPFGGGLPGVVRKLLVMRSGDVVAAGSFGGFIARFDGEWNAIPGGFDYILTLAELPGGRFAGSGWDKVRVWTSTGFSDLSEDPYDVFALLVTRDGKLMVGGNFEGIGSQPAAFLARYGCPCYPNCDNSAAAPSLNVNDLMCFVNSFARRDAYADCDGNGLILASDFLCYLSRFSSGCE